MCKTIRFDLFKSGVLNAISAEISNIISQSDFFKNAQNIMLYYPKNDEINLLSLLKFNKNFYLPKCENDNLSVCPYNENMLELGAYGITEPKTAPIGDLDKLDIIFVPALCADKNNNRLGYGKGFYDKFLKNPDLRAIKIVAVPKKLYFDEIPTDAFDVKCDEVIFA